MRVPQNYGSLFGLDAIIRIIIVGGLDWVPPILGYTTSGEAWSDCSWLCDCAACVTKGASMKPGNGKGVR